MKYIAQYRCVKCDTVLIDHEVFYSAGVCPYCGHINNSTICDVRKVAFPVTPHTSPDWAAILPWIATSILLLVLAFYSCR